MGPHQQPGSLGRRQDARRQPASTTALEASRENGSLISAGETSISLYLEFLCRSNRTDILLLTNMKKAVDGRTSVLDYGLAVFCVLLCCVFPL